MGGSPTTDADCLQDTARHSRRATRGAGGIVGRWGSAWRRSMVDAPHQPLPMRTILTTTPPTDPALPLQPDLDSSVQPASALSRTSGTNRMSLSGSSTRRAVGGRSLGTVWTPPQSCESELCLIPASQLVMSRRIAEKIVRESSQRRLRRQCLRPMLEDSVPQWRSDCRFRYGSQ